MGRRFLAVIGSLAFVACGISVTGLAPLSEVEVEAGTEAGPVAEASADVPFVPPPPDCRVAAACSDAGPCVIESCTKGGSDHFAELNYNGGKVTMDAGTCFAVTAAERQTSALRGELTKLPLHYAYRFDANIGSDQLLGVLVFRAHDHPEVLKGYAFLFVNKGAVSVCRATPGLTDGGSDCPSVKASISDAGVYFRVSGEVDRRDGGKATMVLDLADSPTSCAEALRIDIAGPYEDRLNFIIGCTGPSCTTSWDEARLAVEPLP